MDQPVAEGGKSESCKDVASPLKLVIELKSTALTLNKENKINSMKNSKDDLELNVSDSKASTKSHSGDSDLDEATKENIKIT